MLKHKFLFYVNITILLLVFGAILGAVSVSAEPVTRYREAWKQVGASFLNNIPWGPGLLEDGKQSMMSFYPVEDWELSVCTRYVTSPNQADTTQGADYTRTWYDDVTIAISASKYSYESNNTLYYMDWYVQSYRVLPEGDIITYSVYLQDKTGTRFYISGFENITLETYRASVGAFSQYYAENYTKAVVEYKQSHNPAEHVETNIVIDSTVIYGVKPTN